MLTALCWRLPSSRSRTWQASSTIALSDERTRPRYGVRFTLQFPSVDRDPSVDRLDHAIELGACLEFYAQGRRDGSCAAAFRGKALHPLTLFTR